MRSDSHNLQVLYEDNHIIAIGKQPGDIVQGDKTGDKPLSDIVKDYIKKKYNKPGAVYLGVTHRIDRPTSGIVLFARTSKALERLNKMFQDKAIKKTYWAVTHGATISSSGQLVHHLKKNEKQNKSYASIKGGSGFKRSELHYHVIGKGKNYSFIEINPLTGRHHQIRCQLSTEGWPIKGDVKYGARRSNPDGSIHLHARRIEFIHPVKKEPLVIACDPPNDVLWKEFLNLYNKRTKSSLEQT